MLIVNSRSKRKKSRKSFSLSARKAVAMYCCHGVGERESSNPTPVHEEKCTSEERTERAIEASLAGSAGACWVAGRKGSFPKWQELEVWGRGRGESH